MPTADTIIVGAGAAGLMAAREVKRAGKHVIVLEASNRIGGRILTVYDTNAGVPVELGAEFIHGEAPETTRLLDEARLATVPVLGEHYRSDRGKLSSHGPVWQRMGRVFSHLDPERKTDRSFQQFLDGRPGGPRVRAERELARGFVQGFFGADLQLISEKSLAEEGDPTEGAADARRVIKGYHALIEFLRGEAADVIRLNVRVRRIRWHESHVNLRGANGEDFHARSVIITVPLPMLQDDSIAIEPDIPTMRRAARQLVMGHVVRVNVVVKERFWERRIDDLSFVHAPTRPFNVWWTQHPVRSPFITGWSGGPPALELAASGNIEDAAIGELARAFDMKRNRMVALVDSIHTHDWTVDDNIRGAYSYAGIGGTHAPAVLAREVAGTVFLAGEATDSGSSGTVEAALASGNRAAHKILKRIQTSGR